MAVVSSTYKNLVTGARAAAATFCVCSQLVGIHLRLQGYDESAIRIFCNYPNFIEAASVAPFVPVDNPDEADVLFSPQPINAFMKIPE